MPELKYLIAAAPVRHADWVVDVKIHMLMAGQWPCIPNWHCDNVPRGNYGADYSKASNEHNMLLWISGEPRTEVITDEIAVEPFVGHDALRNALDAKQPSTSYIEPQRWYSFSQLSPHRGTVATQNTWRVFVRLTHRDVVSHRPVRSIVRRHAQVYLDSNKFVW